MIAALPMYHFPWTAAAHDRFWAAMRAALRAEGIAAPDALTCGGDLGATWRSRELLFGQTCGYPYWTALRDTVEILATPIYGFPGCEGAIHCSFLVVRENDPRETLAAFRGARAAVNAADSNSGMNLFRASVAPLAGGRPFFGEVILTGAHAASLSAVADGAADIAAIDCVTFALLRQGGDGPPLPSPKGGGFGLDEGSSDRAPPAATPHPSPPPHGGREDALRVRILARTPSSPALPFIASRALPQKTLASLRAALGEVAPQPALGLEGVAFLRPEAYARVAELEREAAALGYRHLA